MSSLDGTKLDFILGFFGVNTDDELITRMTWIALWYTISVALYSYFFPAPYGRYASSKSGPSMNAKVGWMIQESPVVFVSMLIYLLTPASRASNLANIVPVLLLVAHYINRSFIYTHRMSPKARPVPLLTVISAIIFCAFNGLLQTHHLLNVAVVPLGLNFFVGTAVFITGMYINIHHDNILTKLRESSSSSGKVSTYKIPQGGLFSFVSGANYFGEILEWWGLALITQEYPQIIFAIFSTIFLGLRATHHHEFYKSTFGKSYPSNRKAVIPFIL